jgi:outer membrane protein assembly factor BamE (lipoprotein component of BamABCDE complex)
MAAKLPRILIVTASVSFLLAACANVKEASSYARGPGTAEQSPGLGMTQRQIREMYGEPDSVDRSPCCEVWYYWFKDRRVFIPGDFRSRARNGVFIFGDNGRLKDFGYNQ